MTNKYQMNLNVRRHQKMIEMIMQTFPIHFNLIQFLDEILRILQVSVEIEKIKQKHNDCRLIFNSLYSTYLNCMRI